MPVPNYTPPTKAIRMPRQKDAEGNRVAEVAYLYVRGLSLEDVMSLVNAHMPDITLAVEQYRDSLTDIYSTRSMDGFITTLLTGFPALASAVIASAADAPDAVEQIRRYPSGVQIKALLAIAELSLEDMGDLSDPSPALANLVRQAMSGLSRRDSLLPGGSGPSVATSDA